MLTPAYASVLPSSQRYTLHPLVQDALTYGRTHLWEALEHTQYLTFQRVLEGMQRHRLGEEHFYCVTGYGHNDMGREALDAIFAHALEAEAGLVRPHMVSGTHALSVMLHGLLSAGESMVCLTGHPYDTLEPVIGLGDTPHKQSLIGRGVTYQETSIFTEDGQSLLAAFTPSQVEMIQRAKVLYVQRSRGYSTRKSLSIPELAQVFQAIKAIHPQGIIAVDNCYGEFVEPHEPTAVGADIMAGSLIKNPGGGIVSAGGYIVGRTDLVEACADALTCPGIGREGGYLFEMTRLMLQGLFLAPGVVAEALKSMSLFAYVFETLGKKALPAMATTQRSDIIQTLYLSGTEEIQAVCRAIQACSPVSSYVTPEPAVVPGYESPVIMAGGTFIDGSSIELSADAPLRPPYTLFIQGGLTHAHAVTTLNTLLQSGFLKA
ncbi:MAG: methionine gamma-lyase family protein [Vampirovibrionales bacterium]